MTAEELFRQLSSTRKIQRGGKGLVKPSVPLGCLRILKGIHIYTCW